MHFFRGIRAYGATAWRELRLVAIPASFPWVFAAIRTTVPRALLGVMIAEWLATGRGLGNLMNQSRGYMDFSMIWTVAMVSVLLSVTFYQIAQMAENWLTRRRGRRQATGVRRRSCRPAAAFRGRHCLC